MSLQLLLEDAARLDEQAAIDRLVRHLMSLVVGIGVLQPPRNLLRRPVLLKPGSDQLPQLFMHRQLAGLRSQGSIPRPAVRGRGAIASMTAIAPELAADRRWRSMQLRGNRAQRYAGCNASRDLLAISEAQHASRSSSWCGSNAAMRLQMLEDRPTIGPNTRPISFSPSPRCQRSQTSALSAALNIRRRLFAIASPHLSSGKVLRRPPETTVETGHCAK